MPTVSVPAKLAPIALNEVDTSNFEKFGQSFFAGMMGKNFVPLGGLHDGGADGFFEPELFGDASATHFLQISKQKNYEEKIRLTVQRLRGFGRNPKSITYLTSETIPHIDLAEEKLSEAHGCRILIRDAKFIESNINSSPVTIQAFKTYLEPSIQFLEKPGAISGSADLGIHADKTLAVFLRQEVEHRQGKSALLESVADSLIIWSLSDTDPDDGRFMTRDDVLTKIELTLPTSKQFIRAVLDDRLAKLNAKQPGGDRQIRYYANEKKYCLPFETREAVKQENVRDIALRSSVTEIFEIRCAAISSENERPLYPKVVEVCHRVLETVFEHQGMQVAQFASSGEGDEELYSNVAEIVANVANELSNPEDATLVRRLATNVLRGTFYDGAPEEREYLLKLSHTYVLMLLLKNEPKVVEYFQSLSSKFNLYVGTDFLVRAISEHYLSPENQTTRNLFLILREAGATLILTEKAVEELATHIRSQIFEFENVYSFVEGRITLDAVEYIDKILIRAYFYSRLAPLAGTKPPAGWHSYIDQFANYNLLRADRGYEELARWLVNKFGFTYETEAEMSWNVSPEEIETLSEEILRVKSEKGKQKDKAEILAYNDALQVLRIYERRKTENESSPANPFGFKTWWLTQDGSVRRAAAQTIAKHNGHRFMMRPEFLLNFISFAPSAKEVANSYREIFPSVLGIRLSNRVSRHTFREVVKSANEIFAVDEARAASMITACVNQLKGDTLKVYETNY
jgi:hypothetical protein